ncbi:MAG TPA: PTS system mannose/fructose/sorbose family transporter subunit IID, partial [Longimicrobium sp.]
MAEVTELGAGVRRRMLLRSFAVQGSWNYQTLIGTGLSFVLTPALKHVYAGDGEGLRRALGRHAELFNSHPYLAAVAAGAIARLEAERVPPETVARFKAAVRGSLGTLGDRLVWLMWRPMSVLLGVALVLAGAAWWIGALAFLVVFNAHPYLASLAAGAIARLEADGVPPETVARFKAAVRGSLGSMGDRLVWLMWRPACALLMVALLLAGAGWWIAVAAFLVAYNALHLWMRAWGLDAGWREGLQVARTLREAPFERLGERAGDAGAVLSGFSAVLAVGWGGDHGWPYAVLGLASLVAGIALGPRIRWVAAAALTALLVAGV